MDSKTCDRRLADSTVMFPVIIMIRSLSMSSVVVARTSARTLNVVDGRISPTECSEMYSRTLEAWSLKKMYLIKEITS